MKKKKGKDDFIKKHEFAGGKTALQNVISKNLTYPKEAMEKKVEGSVFLNYEVGFEGQIISVTVLKGIGSGCDEEAIRLVKLLKFSPQNNHGVKIITKHKIKINFKLPTAPKVTKQITLTYTTTKSKTAKEKEIKQKPKPVIAYTIKY